jgi:DNA repair protein RecO (recombination protein O)
MDMLHSTKGIVLRKIYYGETSLIVTVYTELLGIQTYMVKGIRQSSKKNVSKLSYFQPTALLDMVVYHNPLKNIQYIKDYQWHVLYNNLWNHITKQAVALYMAELLHNSVKQEQSQPEIYELTEQMLLFLDAASQKATANIPLYYTLQLSAVLGFQLQGFYNASHTILDLKEGCFVNSPPEHAFYISNQPAQISSEIMNNTSLEAIEHLQLNKNIRRQLLQSYHTYFNLHVAGFGSLKTLSVLEEVL